MGRMTDLRVYKKLTSGNPRVRECEHKKYSKKPTKVRSKTKREQLEIRKTKNLSVARYKLKMKVEKVNN